MKQWVRNYVLFVIMFLLGLFQAVSGFVIWLVLHWKWIIYMTRRFAGNNQ